MSSQTYIIIYVVAKQHNFAKCRTENRDFFSFLFSFLDLFVYGRFQIKLGQSYIKVGEKGDLINILFLKVLNLNYSQKKNCYAYYSFVE